MMRRSWALELAQEGSRMLEVARQQLDELRTIHKAVDVALSNLKMHVSNVQQKHVDAQTWVREVLNEQEPVVVGWEDAVTRLGRIPVNEEVLRSRLFKASNGQAANLGNRRGSFGSSVASLRSLVDVGSADQAALQARQVLERLDNREMDLGESVREIARSSDDLVKKVNTWNARFEVHSEDELTQVMEDIDVIAKKVGSDYDRILTFTETPKSLSQASKKALVHTQDLLPSLGDNAIRLARMQRDVAEERNISAESAVQHLQNISRIEWNLSSVNQQLSTLEIGSEGRAAFDLLGILIRLPYVYGSVLIECIRRREWHERLKKDSSALAEELAEVKDEEERRRRRWHRSLGEDVTTLETTTEETGERTASVEVNLRGEQQSWPLLERHDIEDYLSVLKQLDGMDGIVAELSLLAGELDRSARLSRNVRTFKKDSVHDVAMGRSSLILRGEDDVTRGLRDEKTRLEEKLKGSESRIRKLEDIVHRQSDMSRHASGNLFQSPSGYRPDSRTTPPSTAQPFLPSSRPQDVVSRRSSVSSRRFSANQGNEEKVLVQRVLSLEADLLAEREQVAGLQRENAMRKEAEVTIGARIEEADSTKKDLMENLEAQQREFLDERKLLEEDARKLRGKLEEVEDELDRVIGSREQEKAGSEEKVRMMEVDLDQVRTDFAKNIENLQHEIVIARAESQRCLARATEAEESLQTAMTERQTLEEKMQHLEEQLQRRNEDQAEQLRSLQITHGRLLPGEAAPMEFGRLVEAIQSLTEKSSDRVRNVDESLAMVRADNESLQKRLSSGEIEYANVKDKLGMEEMESFGLRETLAGERGKLSVLEAEIVNKDTELQAMRARFAAGETGSDALKERMAEEEAANTGLRAELAAMRAEVTVFDEELRGRQDTMGAMRAASDALASQLKSRSNRAKEVSQRLYSLIDRLNRLLETLGFMTSYQNGSMIIQRIPKTMSSSGQISADPNMHSPQQRNISASSQLVKRLADSPDLLFVHWMDGDDGDEESRRYSAYVDVVGKLDVEVVCETIAKRMKDTEHIARKWQKEARSYRDRAHRFQSDAHDKIAFRGFREGDLALFLPTRNQATRPWAAFNVGAPHYFLREQDAHKLRTRDWLLARITKVEERVVDLSRAIAPSSSSTTMAADGRSVGGESSDGGASFDDENPFELSDGLRWYLLDAAEEKPGAPSTPGLGKSTVASANVDARGSVRVKKSAFSGGASKTLHKSLDSRRSSFNRKESAGSIVNATPSTTATAVAAAAGGSAGTTTVRTAAGGPSVAGIGESTSNRAAPTMNVESPRSGQIRLFDEQDLVDHLGSKDRRGDDQQTTAADVNASIVGLGLGNTSSNDDNTRHHRLGDGRIDGGGELGSGEDTGDGSADHKGGGDGDDYEQQRQQLQLQQEVRRNLWG